MDLSVIIPARNEEFLKLTIESVLSSAEAETEVIAICDGNWPDPPVDDHPRVTLVYHPESIGQRAGTNEGVRLSRAKYIMKLDAHCSLDRGFDVKLMKDCEYDWTVLPRMYTLEVFRWKCMKCGREFEQGGPMKKCEKTKVDKHTGKKNTIGCGAADCIERVTIWKPRRRKRTDYMWFDNNLRIGYFDKTSLRNHGDPAELKPKCSHKKRDWAQGDITDVMNGIGACWFQHRERYLELGGLDENHGSWGQVAVEVACKAWLSGGRHVVNKNTWFAHLARTQKDFSWPYPMSIKDQEAARAYSRNLWLNNNWPGQKHNIDWLAEKFGPLPGWHL